MNSTEKTLADALQLAKEYKDEEKKNKLLAMQQQLEILRKARRASDALTELARDVVQIYNLLKERRKKE